VDRLKWLKIRVKRDAGELCRSTTSLFQDLLIFLGAELTSICAREYAIIVNLRHTFLLSTLALVIVSLEVSLMIEKSGNSYQLKHQNGTVPDFAAF
jgi:hypothetical protein